MKLEDVKLQAKPKPEFVRASGLPRLEICPPSLVTSAGEPNIGSEATEMGSAFHEVMEHRAKSPGDCDLERPALIGEIAEKYHVPRSGLEYLAKTFTWSPHQLPRLEEVIVEEELRKDRIVGHLDLGFIWTKSNGRKILEVVDYKTGDPSFGVDAEDSLQVLWYTANLAEIRPNVDEVKASIAYVKLGEEGWSQYQFDQYDAGRILGRAKQVALDALEQWRFEVEDRAYCRGDHCEWCAGQYHCPFYLRSIRAIMENPEAAIQTVSPCDLYQMANGYERMAKKVKGLCQKYVRQHGPRPSTDGQWVLEERSSLKTASLGETYVEFALDQVGVDEELRDRVMEIVRDRPQSNTTRCQPYRAKKGKGARDA